MLIKELGGPDASGIGFAIGIERLSLGIPDDERFNRTLDFYVAILGEAARSRGLQTVHALRGAGYSAETRYTPMSLKAQMKLADKLRARKVVMIGDEELQRGEAMVRDMVTKEQKSVPFDDPARWKEES
jgi:histidyl-tRNA synthetase